MEERVELSDAVADEIYAFASFFRTLGPEHADVQYAGLALCDGVLRRVEALLDQAGEVTGRVTFAISQQTGDYVSPEVEDSKGALTM